MGLFSSKSRSSSTSTNQTISTDNSTKVSGTVGDLSKGNTIAGGNVYGYSGEETQAILDSTLKHIDASNDNLKDITSKAITQVQSAYSGANNSILQSQNETKTLLNSLQPFAFAAAAVVAVYFIFGKKGR